MTNENEIHGQSAKENLEKDMSYSPASDSDDDALQETPVADSPAVDSDMESADITVLPGTGGPDDDGDVEVDPSELNLSGDSIPGHPKPASHPH